jgi:hypothetical protein
MKIGNAFTNGKGGDESAKIHCQIDHGDGRVSNSKYFTNFTSNDNIFYRCAEIEID